MKAMRILLAVCAIAGLAAAAGAQAQSYPAKSVRVVVPWPPGGTSDILARIAAEKFQQLLGQPFVVDNRPGATGIIGSAEVAKAAPDGYTLKLANIGSDVVAPVIYPKPGWDPATESTPIGMIAVVGNVLVVHPSVPARTVQEFIAHAKANPGRIAFGSSGNGTTLHLSGILFNEMAGTELIHVPYKGSGPALNDLLGGQIQSMFDNLPSAVPHIKAGKLRALAMTGARRVDALPEVPTVGEGLPGYEVTTWFGIFGPGNMPREVVNRLNEALRRMVELPDVKARLAQQGVDPLPLTAEEMAALYRRDQERWIPLVRRHNLRAQ